MWMEMLAWILRIVERRQPAFLISQRHQFVDCILERLAPSASPHPFILQPISAIHSLDKVCAMRQLALATLTAMPGSICSLPEATLLLCWRPFYTVKIPVTLFSMSTMA